MEAGDENGVSGDVDALLADAFTDVRKVQKGGGDAGVGFTGVSATGAAVEACCVGVVDGLAAVTTEEDDAGEVGSESHVLKCAVAEGDLVSGGDAGVVVVFVIATGVMAGGGVDVGGGGWGLVRVAGRGWLFEEGVLEEAYGESEASGFDEGEAGDG